MPCRPEDMDSAARRVACRAIGCAPAHAVPVGCFVPQFVWVFASRECLPSPIAREGCTVLAYRTHTSFQRPQDCVEPERSLMRQPQEQKMMQ